MKKLVLMAIALLVSGMLQAQEKYAKTEKKSFIALHAGPTFPVGDFNSNNTGNENAGFAKTGYTINLNYGYNFVPKAGITASVFYNSYKTHQFSTAFLDGNTQAINLDIDHWKFYGLSAGPMLTFDLRKNIYSDIKVMGGIVNANSPKVTYNGVVMAEDDWSWAPAFQGGINVRIGTGSNLFVFGNADFMYMKPKFSYKYTNENQQLVNEDIKQKISAVNVSAGVGFNF
jgi:hypothetical protein